MCLASLRVRQPKKFVQYTVMMRLRTEERHLHVEQIQSALHGKKMRSLIAYSTVRVNPAWKKYDTSVRSSYCADCLPCGASAAHSFVAYSTVPEVNPAWQGDDTPVGVSIFLGFLAMPQYLKRTQNADMTQ